MKRDKYIVDFNLETKAAFKRRLYHNYQFLSII
jgi:hypothetical protein